MRDDARFWQVMVLSGILLFGVVSLDFPLSLTVIVLTLASGVLSEYLFSAMLRSMRTPRPLSATISSLSVLLLFRSSVVWAYPLVIMFAVASKYVVRWRGRHWLNPTNFAVLMGTLLLPGWLSSGQWGHLAVLPLALGGLGILVLLRAGRLDSALTFLALSSALECTRILYYGYPHPIDIFVHRLNNGALWLFTFYMLTDPQTTPQARWGRILHASLVALLSFYFAEWWYWKDTPLWALLFVAPTVPLLDWLHASRSTFQVSRFRSKVQSLKSKVFFLLTTDH
jgi:Na+-transporting NADH:ubiquinone oxidoreductase subunit NqrB